MAISTQQAGPIHTESEALPSRAMKTNINVCFCHKYERPERLIGDFGELTGPKSPKATTEIVVNTTLFVSNNGDFPLIQFRVCNGTCHCKNSCLPHTRFSTGRGIMEDGIYKTTLDFLQADVPSIFWNGGECVFDCLNFDVIRRAPNWALQLLGTSHKQLALSDIAECTKNRK